MFCLELLTKITLNNHARINFVWVLVSDHFASIVQMAKSPSEYVEKAIVCLLLLCVTLAPKKEFSSHIFNTFELFLNLESSVANAMSESIIIAVSRFLKSHNSIIPNANSWKIILALVERSANSTNSYERGFQTLLSLLDYNTSPSSSSSSSLDDSNQNLNSYSFLLSKSPPILNENAFYPYLRAVLAFINLNFDPNKTKSSSNTQKNNHQEEEQQPKPILSSSGNNYLLNTTTSSSLSHNNNNNNMIHSPSRDSTKQQQSSTQQQQAIIRTHVMTNQPIPIQAMNILYQLFEYAAEISVPKDSKQKLIHVQKIWNQYWLPIFQTWISLCRHSRNDIRTHSMTLLQRALLSQHLFVLTPEGIRQCFEEVMFPLLTNLLQPFPDIKSEDSRVAVEETRVRAQQLLSKSLLQYLNQLTQLRDFHTNLWPKILCMIEAYMHADENGLLKEAIPEVLKNVLLVMLQMNVFHPSNTIRGQDIWTISWMTIDGFCPSLKEDESFRSSLNTFRMFFHFLN